MSGKCLDGLRRVILLRAGVLDSTLSNPSVRRLYSRAAERQAETKFAGFRRVLLMLCFEGLMG